jgi:hypothetical protein
MKTCPFCAEEIQDAAVVCKHCGRNQPVDGAASIAVSVPRANLRSGPSDSAAVVSIVTRGTRYDNATDTGNGWFRVKLATGADGYLSAAVVKNAAEVASGGQLSPGSLRCDKCQGEMRPTRVRRFSHGLVVLGYLMMIFGFLPMLGAAACGLLSTGSVVKNAATGMDDSKTIRELDDIAGLPSRVVDEYRSTHEVSERTISGLTSTQQHEVRMALAGDVGRKAGGAMATGITAGASIVTFAVASVIGIPLLIVGLLLTLRRNVWQCGDCSYIFDRA